MTTRAKTLDDFVREALREVEEISPEEGRRRLEQDPSWHFLDVREPDEYADGHIPGARSSPRGFLEVKADLAHEKRDPWLADRERRLVLYCGGGNRSALAARTLQQMGFTRVVSLAQGWKGWSARGFPVER